MTLPEGTMDKLFSYAKDRRPDLSWYQEGGLLCCQDVDYPGNRKPTAGIQLNPLTEEGFKQDVYSSRDKLVILLVDTVIKRIEALGVE